MPAHLYFLDLKKTMKLSRFILVIRFPLFILGFLLICICLMASELSAEYPLNCDIISDPIGDFISCEVIYDGVQVVEVIVNGGDCVSPLATDEDFQLVDDNTFFSDLLGVIEGNSDVDGKLIRLFVMLTLEAGMSIHPDGASPLVRAMLSPRGVIEFGDSFNLLLLGCEDVSEFEVCTQTHDCWLWELY